MPERRYTRLPREGNGQRTLRTWLGLPSVATAAPVAQPFEPFVDKQQPLKGLN